jgi:ElaB/YqjD/DUF883 family membrane-anchored ribosome-binding protein
MDEGTRESSPQLAEPAVNDQSKPPETEELRRDIAETREELGDTVEALAQKADVKSQAKAKVAERKEKLREKQEGVKAKVGEVREKVGSATPEQARDAATQLTARAKERPAPTAAVGVLLVGIAIGWLVARR